MIKQAQRNGLITGLASNLIDKGVAVLQYADATIICLENNIDAARNMKLLHYLYEIMSGLKINFSKSEIVMINENDMLGKQFFELYNC